MQRRGGFPVSIFCNQARSEAYQCLICFEVCRSPVTCRSGAHLFCQDCLAGSLRRNPSCPVCRERLAAPVPSAFATAQVSALDVVCVHEKCKWKGTCGRLDGHLDIYCLHEPIKCSGEGGCATLVPRGEMETHQQFACPQSCPNSTPKAGDEQDVCDVRLSRADSIDHLRDHCKLRLVHCPHPYCEVSTRFNRMPAHLETCPYAPVPCPRGCGARDLIRRGLDAHKSDCPNEPVPCVHAHLGCSHVAPRCEIIQHEQDVAVHFSALSKLYVEQQRQIHQMEQVFEEVLQAQTALFQQKLSEQAALFDEKLQALSVPALGQSVQVSPVQDHPQVQATPSAIAKQVRSKADPQVRAGPGVTPLEHGLKCYSCGKPATVFFRNDKEPHRNDSYCKNGVSGTCSAYSHMFYGTSRWGHPMSKSVHVDLILRTK